MRYLKTFENTENGSTIKEDIIDSFISFFDEVGLDNMLEEDDESIVIYIETNYDESILKTTNFDTFYKSKLEEQKRLFEINSSLNKFKRIHPDIFTKFQYGEDCITLQFFLDKMQQYEYYSINSNNTIVHLDENNILKYLNCKDIDKISIWRPSDHIEIRFRTSELLKNNSNSIIDKMLKLKIGGDYLVSERELSLPFGKKEMSKYKIEDGVNRTLHTRNGRVDDKVYGIKFYLNKKYKFE